MQQQLREEVYEKLALVIDPELDQSLTELEFINNVVIDESTVTVSFRLPTYWCSPNFAFIMAVDIRDRVSELPWVSDVVVQLEDHSAADEINEGIALRKSFSETFPSMSNGELDELRKTFRNKAFVARQERLLRHLVGLGLTDAEIVTMTVRQLRDFPLAEMKGLTLRERYLAIHEELGHDSDPEQAAFTQLTGESLDINHFADYLSEARRTRLSLEFNGHYCRGLFQTRYATEQIDKTEAVKL